MYISYLCQLGNSIKHTGYLYVYCLDVVLKQFPFVKLLRNDYMFLLAIFIQNVSGGVMIYENITNINEFYIL